jgi:hypothetical protein
VCARKCRAKHPRATLGVRDVAFPFAIHSLLVESEKFSYTGKLNPASGIHFLSENLGLEGITAARALARASETRKRRTPLTEARSPVLAMFSLKRQRSGAVSTRLARRHNVPPPSVEGW